MGDYEMRQILKFTLNEDATRQAIPVPTDAQFLDIQIQNGKIVFWVIGNLALSKKFLDFCLIQTGEEYHLASEWIYLKTLQLCNGTFILHLFLKLELGDTTTLKEKEKHSKQYHLTEVQREMVKFQSEIAMLDTVPEQPNFKDHIYEGDGE